MAVQHGDVGDRGLEIEPRIRPDRRVAQLGLGAEHQEILEDVLRRIGDRDAGLVDLPRREVLHVAVGVVELAHRIQRVGQQPEPLARGDDHVSLEAQDRHPLGLQRVRVVGQHAHLAQLGGIGVDHVAPLGMVEEARPRRRVGRVVHHLDRARLQVEAVARSAAVAVELLGIHVGLQVRRAVGADGQVALPAPGLVARLRHEGRTRRVVDHVALQHRVGRVLHDPPAWRAPHDHPLGPGAVEHVPVLAIGDPVAVLVAAMADRLARLGAGADHPGASRCGRRGRHARPPRSPCGNAADSAPACSARPRARSREPRPDRPRSRSGRPRSRASARRAGRRSGSRRPASTCPSAPAPAGPRRAPTPRRCA